MLDQLGRHPTRGTGRDSALRGVRRWRVRVGTGWNHMRLELATNSDIALSVEQLLSGNGCGIHIEHQQRSLGIGCVHFNHLLVKPSHRKATGMKLMS